MTPRVRALQALFGPDWDRGDISCGERDSYVISIPALERAIRAAERDARAEIKERAAQVASEEAGNADLEGGEMWIALKIARDISALPEEPPHG